MVNVFAIVGDLFKSTSTVAINTILTLGNPTFLCIVGSRMFFNLKEAGERGVNPGTNWSSHSYGTVAPLHFTRPRVADDE